MIGLSNGNSPGGRITAHRLKNDLGATTVDVEHNRLGQVELTQESRDDARVGPTPGEDRLFVIADREQRTVLSCEEGQDAILVQIEILELIDEDVIPAGLALGADLFAGFEQLAGAGDDVVVVDQVVRLQLALVLPEQGLVVLAKL